MKRLSNKPFLLLKPFFPLFRKKAHEPKNPCRGDYPARVFRHYRDVISALKGIIEVDPWSHKVTSIVFWVEGGVALDILENALDINIQ
jgi:hypothetical protein